MKLVFILLGGISLMLTASGVSAQTVQAQPDAALRVLLGQSHGTTAGAPSTSASASSAVGGGPTVVVRPGETLAHVVRAHYKGSPFNDAFIYKAIVQFNPSAFPRKTHHMVTAGATLILPSHADLVEMVHETSSAGANTSSASGPSALVRPGDRKSWVRFP